jgi:predicted dinucleotide-utilizing enzyme
MKLNEFIVRYDKEDSIILLEGKRLVNKQDRKKLIALGKLLASNTINMKFRSGNAGGADQLFSDGVTSVDSTRLQVITPYAGHRQKTNNAFETISLDKINIRAEHEVVYRSKNNKKMEKLIDQYVSGIKNRYTVKAAYIIRDTVKVVGTSEIRKASFGIFYDDLGDPMTGGTGHTMKTGVQINLPIIDQRTWFDWLK